MISYRKLWMYLRGRCLKRTYLLYVISTPTLAKLGKDENISVDTIVKICVFLGCQPKDIMEVV